VLTATARNFGFIVSPLKVNSFYWRRGWDGFITDM